MKEVNNQSLWSFELGSQENMHVSKWNYIGFQQRERQDSQTSNKYTFCRLPVTSRQCIIGTEKYPDNCMFLSYDDDYSQGYSQKKETFITSTKVVILQPFLSDHDFSSSNVKADDISYNLYVLDIRSQQKFTASQPIKFEFSFDGVVPSDINGYALVKMNKLVSISSDGQRYFNLI